MDVSLGEKIELGKKVMDYNCNPEFPKNMLLEVTNICNDRCIFCANRKSTRKKGYINYEKALKILHEAYENGTREVGFYATGEPLINKDLEKYIKYAKDIGYEYTYITTNGVLLGEERANSLLEAGIDSIKFSINAVNKKDYILVHGKDDFEVVVENLRNLSKLRKKYKFKLYISCILTNQTVNSKKEFIDYFYQYVDEIWFDNCSNIGGYMCELDELVAVNRDARHHFKNNICPIIFKNLYVTYEGYLTMCCTDFQNYLVVANLDNESLYNAWNNKYAVKLRKCHIEHKLDGLLCNNCMLNCEKDIVPLVEEYGVKFDYSTWNNMELIKDRIDKWSKD